MVLDLLIGVAGISLTDHEGISTEQGTWQDVLSGIDIHIYSMHQLTLYLSKLTAGFLLS